MEKRVILGIDPGCKGSISFYDMTTNKLMSFKMPETPKDVYDMLSLYPEEECICYLERVHGQPGMSGAGMFNFGKGYGHIEMALIALKISTVTVPPQTWMKAMGVGTKGDRTPSQWKNYLKSKAQQLFPSNKFTLDTSDAALIARYGFLKEREKAL